MNVFHIGARGNPIDEWKRIRKHVNIYGFDADKEACKKLDRQELILNSQQFFPLVVAGTEKERNFYVTRNPECSSLLKPIQEAWVKFERSKHIEIKEIIKVKPVTLNKFCNEKNIYPDFIKLDVQGAELEILEFFDFLDEVVGIEIEVFFTQLYYGQRFFSDVDIFLRRKGFELFGLKRCRWKEGNINLLGGRPIFGDALYLKRKDTPVFRYICRKYRLLDVISSTNGKRSDETKLRMWDEEYIF